MALRPDVQTFTIEEDGRYALPRAGTGPDDYTEVDVTGDVGGGTMTVQKSWEASPVLATDAHWTDLIDSDGNTITMTPGRVYAFQTKAALSVKLAGSSSPDLVIITA